MTSAREFRYTSTEPRSSFQCKVDRGGWNPCRPPKAYFRIAEGWHTLRVRARDRAGNVDPTPAVRRFRVT